MLLTKALPRTLPSLRLSLRSLSTSVPAVPSAASAVSSTQPTLTSQSPNVPTPWSPSQSPRALAMTGPRFEQTHLELQPQPLSAMGLVAEQAVKMVDGRRAICDGGEWLFFSLDSFFLTDTDASLLSW